MRSHSHPARIHPIRESAQVLKRDLSEARTQLLDDTVDLARAGKGEFDTFVRSTLFVASAAAFVAGGVIGFLMRRR